MADTTLTDDRAERVGSQAGRRRRAHPRWVQPLLRAVAAVAGGVLVYLAFPPAGLWPLAPVGVAVIAVVTYRQRPRRGALLGFFAGLGLFVPLLVWIKVMLSGLAITGLVAWIVVAVLQAAFFALLGAGLSLVTRLPGWPVWSAATWVAQEALRGSIPFGGFTWGRLAFSQGYTAFTPYASVGGAPFVTFMVALTGGLVAWAALSATRVRAGPPRRALAYAAAALAAALVPPAAGYAVPLPSGGQMTTVAAVQGNVPRAGLDALRQARSVLRNHVEATHELAERARAGALPKPEIVVWPENASDINPYTNARARKLIESAVDDVGVPVMVGALSEARDPQYIRNISIVWSPETGAGETYLKRRLVPFGEYVPFRDFMTRLVPVYEELRPRDILAGSQPGSVTVGGVPIAVTICFDIAYDSVVREAVRAGGKLLVVQTNNASFGGTPQPEQQLAIERLRAVEHGRAVVVAATSGISAVISPDGRLLEVSKPFTQQVLVERVPLRGELTIADRLGAIPRWALTGIGVLSLLVAVVVSARPEGRTG